jgi:hypothetical protein
MPCGQVTKSLDIVPSASFSRRHQFSVSPSRGYVAATMLRPRIAGRWHGAPARVLAPHRAARRRFQVLTRMGVDGWRALRLLAVERDTTVNALAIEAFNDLLKKYGKRQSVENPLLD